jgi:hypothetical protein
MKANDLRYLVTDVVSIPVIRNAKKGDAYRMATRPGWGIIDSYSETNNYFRPVNRDKDDKSQALYCDDDSSAVLYPAYGREFVISPNEEVNLKKAPKQSEVDAMIISGPCGYSFWAKETGDVKIFVTYDENGLIDTYRLDNWSGKPYDGEIEISFCDLQSEYEHDKTGRAEIVGTLEHERRNKNEPEMPNSKVFLRGLPKVQAH